MQVERRELKFRAWNNEVNEMIDIHKITPLALNDGMNDQLALQRKGGLFLPFFPEIILMQYTGLKDKNGKEIYEGDILEAKLKDFIWRGVIEFGWATTDQNEYGWHYRGRGPIRPQDGIDKKMEVIGNIYENPELLK